jgi:dTDP-4-amino-4,6-dideoxygalactose transaminase
MRARQKGVLASVHFAPPVHRQKPYEAYFRDLPNTDYLSTHIISLPIYPGLAESEIGLVTDVMNEVANEVG